MKILLTTLLLTFSSLAEENKKDLLDQDDLDFIEQLVDEELKKEPLDEEVFEQEMKDLKKIEQESTREPASAKKESRVCEKPSCANLTKDQEDCVVKRRCNPEIRKLVKKNQELEEKLREAESRIAYLEALNSIEDELKKINQAKVAKHRKNAINLILGRAPTGIKTERNYEGRPTKSKSVAQNDAGLMYQRDLGRDARFRGSLGLTLRGSGFLGIGYNF